VVRVPKIDADLVRALTPAGLLLLLVLMLISAFMLGLIRPGRAIAEVREDRDARLADKDEQIRDWQEAHRVSEAAREKEAESTRIALEASRATADLLRALRTAANWERADRTAISERDGS
jgi:hypothetical protein